jgi:hypothetical protein
VRRWIPHSEELLIPGMINVYIGFLIDTYIFFETWLARFLLALFITTYPKAQHIHQTPRAQCELYTQESPPIKRRALNLPLELKQQQLEYLQSQTTHGERGMIYLETKRPKRSQKTTHNSRIKNRSIEMK